ncbi:MAG: type II toxin-antitoxin system death-on-curing family toxin [Acidobacteria bacterium]|nr:MAG: type II toxin-antitoxin system death-on-curing family toxin [Acidobacteriota bacterium]
MTFYLSIDQVEELHALQLRHYGGSGGLRDRGGLESALARPAMTFGGEDLYPDLASKAAALMHSLVMNHPYVDGNKRVGAHAAIVFLRMNGERLEMTSKELEELTLTVARGELDAEALAIWFRQRISREN